MSFKEKVERYIKEKQEEQVKRQEVRQVEFGEKLRFNKEKIQPLIEVLNKLPVGEFLEEIKKEEKQWKDSEIYEIPQKITPFTAGCAEIKLAKIHSHFKKGRYITHWDREIWEPAKKFIDEDSVGIGAQWNEDGRIKFYGIFLNDHSLNVRERKVEDAEGLRNGMEICLVDDQNCFQKIEEFLIEKVLESREKR